MQKLYDAVDANRTLILDAWEQIRDHPELGFREWKTHEYLKERFLRLGYELTEAGNIPGFFTDVDTGREGPTVAFFGELDALPCPAHPLADPETGAAHACGHDCQCAILLGLAAALKTPGVLDGMVGKIRLIAVPAEEGVSAAYRQELKEKKMVRYYAGKPEFLARGYLDDVDIAMMIHTTTDKKKISCTTGSNGNVRKKATFLGRSAHAAAPAQGINALYAATNALSIANALRETFLEKDKVRMHPILPQGGNVVNAIPDEVVIENMIRGADYDTINRISHQINRAYAGAAAAMGCRVVFDDIGGSAPRTNDENLREIFHEIALDFFGEEEMNFHDAWGAGCSDMGDISCVIPSIHPFVGGAEGVSHAANYVVVDPEMACVTAAKIGAGVLRRLLLDDGALAKKVVAEKKLPYASKEDFFAVKDALSFAGDGVLYGEDGSVSLRF